MPRTYVDNAMNRSIGRVGMSVGSMPVSKGSSYGGGGDGYGSSSYGSSSYGSSSYGSSNWNSSGYSSLSSSSGSKTYVDNAMNRSIGRVGKPVGSMPVSRGPGYSSSGIDYGSSSRNDSGYSSPRSLSSSKTYVDNAMNRSIGRVDLPVGTMPVSRNSSSSRSYTGNRHDSLNDSVFTKSPSSTDTYVDNATNRSLGRVGKLRGSMPVSRKSSSRIEDDGNSSLNDSVFSRSSSVSDTYVDNAMNRSLGRVGKTRGSMPVSKSAKGTSGDSSSSHKETSSSRALNRPASESEVKVYKDTYMNRRLERNGKPLGSMPMGKKSTMSQAFESRVKVYKDNALNRRLGRNGRPLGSMPLGKKSSVTKTTREMIENMKMDERMRDKICRNCEDDDVFEKYDKIMKQAMLNAFYNYNRQCEEAVLRQDEGIEKQSETRPQDAEGIINYHELELGKKIGSGGFGDVYFAEWRGDVVAVKKIKSGAISRRRLKDFVNEMMLFCELDHGNIVRYIGACIERPDLCIVMEYMQMSLFEAIHIRNDTDFSEVQRIDIVRQICKGLKYLHRMDIAHRDMKSSNVLISFQEDAVIEVKISDFGLSSMKGNVESTSSYSSSELIGTPRYSAPEILRGARRFTVEDWKKADIYSLALVLFEVVFEDEPFYDYTVLQLVKYVGKYGVTPEIPGQPPATTSVLKTIKQSWSFYPESRPEINEIYDVFRAMQTIYETEG